jgi:ubiquinone/menaquinone biosynthesis C-methylase UbiE
MTTKFDPTAFDAVDGENPDYFIRFLDARLTIEGELQVKRLIAGLLDAQPGHAVLDVGAGTGADTEEVAGRVGPSGRVIGLDISPSMVAEAKRRTAGTELPLEFVEGDAGLLDYADASFDRCRGERILMAMGDPASAVRELGRVTKPEGLVVLSELDSSTIFLNSSNQSLVDRLLGSFSAQLKSPHVGRQLHRLMLEAGLDDVRCAPTVIQNSVKVMQLVFSAQLQQLVDTGEATPAEVAEFWAELQDGEQAGWLCSGVVCFTVVGQKP